MTVNKMYRYWRLSGRLGGSVRSPSGQRLTFGLLEYLMASWTLHLRGTDQYGRRNGTSMWKPGAVDRGGSVRSPNDKRTIFSGFRSLQWHLEQQN